MEPAGEAAAFERGAKVTGIFQSSPRRGGQVVPDTAGLPEVRIPPTAMGAALHGDHVQVEVFRSKPGRVPSGSITRILKHAHKQILGRFQRAGKYCVVVPKNPRIRRLVHIYRKFDPAEVPEGSWVMVEVTRWADEPDEPLTGRLIEVLGTEEQRGLPILLLIRERGVAIEFTPEVEAEARALETAPPAAGKRLDLRHERVCTIDPATAKDFDDAISLHGAGEGGWRIGVHIADVAHYVRPGTAIDLEAYDRATSIYPVDRVIPMLPEALSNQLCSLRPDEDKLTMTVLFDVDRHGGISNVEMHNSIIRSMRRFAYEEVQGLFDRADQEAGIEPEPAPKAARPCPLIDPKLLADLMQIRQAARALNQARIKRGALDLDLPETEILFDAEGRVSDLRRRERFEAHRLIEEMMVAANEAVARELERRGYPALYRVHAEPDEGKLRTVAPVMTRLGIPLPARRGITREELQRAIDAAHRHPAGVIVQRWLLRTMMRAKYQPENIGHYGLASDSYLHFTSPIRRYPDLIVHRVVKELLAGVGANEGSLVELGAGLAVQGRHTSAREERSQKIEWNAEETLALEFMRRYIGDIFDGFISGIIGAGFFVGLSDWPVEGFVPIRLLEDDYYVFDEELHMWRGQRSGRTYAIGDPVTVLIERIDVIAKQMDLVLVKRKTGTTGRAKKKAAPQRKTAPRRPPKRGWR